MCLAAQLPKALEPPARLTSATKAPKITKNMKIPAVSEIAEIKPLLITVSMVLVKLKLVANKPPNKIPMKSEE